MKAKKLNELLNRVVVSEIVEYAKETGDYCIRKGGEILGPYDGDIEEYISEDDFCDRAEAVKIDRRKDFRKEFSKDDSKHIAFFRLVHKSGNTDCDVIIALRMRYLLHLFGAECDYQIQHPFDTVREALFCLRTNPELDIERYFRGGVAFITPCILDSDKEIDNQALKIVDL